MDMSSTDCQQMKNRCCHLGYLFPRSFLRFPCSSFLRISCCWWMRKEIRGGVQPGAVVRYPVRTTTWKQKSKEAKGIQRRRELAFTSPFVSSSWVISRFDLRLSCKLSAQESSGAYSFSFSVAHLPSICTGWQETQRRRKINTDKKKWRRNEE